MISLLNDVTGLFEKNAFFGWNRKKKIVKVVF